MKMKSLKSIKNIIWIAGWSFDWKSELLRYYQSAIKIISKMKDKEEMETLKTHAMFLIWILVYGLWESYVEQSFPHRLYNHPLYVICLHFQTRICRHPLNINHLPKTRQTNNVKLFSSNLRNKPTNHLVWSSLVVRTPNDWHRESTSNI